MYDVTLRSLQVTEVRKDVHMIHHEIDQLQSAKDEMLDLRDSVVRLEQQQRRRKARSIDQVGVDDVETDYRSQYGADYAESPAIQCRGFGMVLTENTEGLKPSAAIGVR